MKKIFKGIALAAAILAASTVSAADRSSTLKVYNWSSYIAEGVISDFEKWYFEQTGVKIEVTYMTFDVNEAMLSKIEKGHEDYDVVCPSDYIIERMLNTGLLQPLDFAEIPDSINYIKANRSPYIEGIFRSINPEKDANDYSVAYMWGTTGIIYNPAHVTREEASTWDVIRDPKFAGKILLKDAPRDVFAPVLIYLRQEQLKNGTVTLQELMRDSSDESIADVENYLMECKGGVCGFEADLGKEQMTKDRAWVSLNWSGDAVWAIEEAASVGVELDYVVPEEGSTVWFDGWVIPKYAKNIKAATYFIDFMCRPDIAVRNMEETGYVAANCSEEILESITDSTFAAIDLSYFFGEGAEAVCANPIVFPDKQIIDRCALEHDWGEKTEALLAMWQNVKGSRANALSFIIIAVAIIAIAAYFAVSSANKKNRKSSRKKRK